MDTPNLLHPGLRIPKDPMYLLLREGCITEFNARKAAGDKADVRECDLRGLDLRGLDAEGLDFSGSYFRQADLRGV
ncbi:MAG: pentapeptide repeat-containing protein, partial [Nitrospira sp.]|nr:pentapeptide repeat-containing protein [Nitrospira sp.]